MIEGSLKKMIRVCFVSPKAWHLFDSSSGGVIGGAEVDVYLLATELAKDDQFDVSCITADYDQPDTQLIENVKVIKSLNFKQNPVACASKIWKSLKLADADIYMMKTPSPGVPLVAHFCKRFKRKFVYRNASEREFNGVYKSKHPFIYKLFIRSIRKADFVTLQNNADSDNLNSLMTVNSRVLPNAHRIENVLDRPRHSILWSGRSAPIKRPDLFMELAKKMPDQNFTMICQRATGDNDYDSLLEKAAEIPNLEFHKNIPFAQVDDFFANAKTLVNTSDSEGFPNTFIQACKASTPILTLNVNPDGFLDKHNCGICSNGDFDKLTSDLQDIISTEKAVQMGQNGRGYVEQKHDIAKIIQQYKQIFKNLIDQKGDS